MPTREEAERIRRQRFWMQLDAFALSQELSVAKAILVAIDSLRATLSDDVLARIAAQQDYTALFEQMDWRGVQLALRDVVERTASDALESGLGGITQIRFDVMHPYVIDALRDYESKAVQVLQQNLQSGVMQYLERTVPVGTNPLEIARGLKGIIGLPENLVQAQANYRSYLLNGDKRALQRAIRDKRFDSTLQRAIKQGQGLPAAKVDQIMERWTARALRINAETIARTATMDAVNMGNRLAWQQLIADDKVEEQRLRRWWVVARDERTCERCRPIPMLNPTGRAWNEPFVTPEDGLVMWPTLHFRCRCVLWTEQVED